MSSTFKGHVDSIRISKRMTFIMIRDIEDPSVVRQCVIDSDAYQKILADRKITSMYPETFIKVTGEHVPTKGKTADGMEIQVSEIEILSLSKPITCVGPESQSSVKLSNAHLVLRFDKDRQKIVRFHHYLLSAARSYYEEQGMIGVTPPSFGVTQCEGGSTVFDFKYFDKTAYLSQSAQLYLEYVLVPLGNVYSITPSFRAEKSHTRRHLTEYTHIEAEMHLESFEDLKKLIPHVIKGITRKLLENPKAVEIIKEFNPDYDFQAFIDEDFVIMSHADAIDWLNERGVLRKVYDDHGRLLEEVKWTYEDDINEAPERFMTDTIGKPVMLHSFPKNVKAFYTKPSGVDRTGIVKTDSIDLLLPGVGEVVGSSMRMSDLDELMEAIEENKFDPADYYPYIDQRKYGSVPHGGYGIGAERLITWYLDLHTIREVPLFVRAPDVSSP